MTSLSDLFTECIPLLPESFRAEHARLFLPEHLDRLSARLRAFHRDGVPSERPLPHFSAECTPPLLDSFGFFAPALKQWAATSNAPPPSLIRAFADAMTAAGCAHLLLLLGQRRTPASLTDARGIPPPRTTLLASALRPCGPSDPLTVAARALSKHAHRSPAQFWGAATGSVSIKNEAAAALLNRILDEATWWNVFGHYKHNTVFEARVPTGHGVRWGQDGQELIGFLEPFDEDERMDAES